MPWADSVAGLVHAWYLGNATGDTIADVLFGKHNPSGRLSITFPKREEDVPAFGHFRSENGKVRYGENLFVVSQRYWKGRLQGISQAMQGYKHYQHRQLAPLFPFGYIFFRYRIVKRLTVLFTQFRSFLHYFLFVVPENI